MAWPTTTNPKRIFVTIRLTDGEAESLDDFAKAQGLSRSAALRYALTSSGVVKGKTRRGKARKVESVEATSSES